MIRTTMGLVAAAWLVACSDTRWVAELAEGGPPGADDGNAGGGDGTGGAGESQDAGGSASDSAGSAGHVAAPDPDVDPDLLSDCESNKTATGGYWRTYTDVEGVAEITPKTDSQTAFPTTPGSYDGSHACHVQGTVTETPTTVPYTDECHERLVPRAELGLGFRPGNAPYDLTGMAGVSFWAKSGSGAFDVNVAVAQTTTEMAADDDDFESTCLCIEEAKAAGEQESCRAHYGIAVELSETWQQCWVFFHDMAPPTWGEDKGFDPAQAVKLLWQMPRSDVESVPFDVWVDDVRWITDEEAATGPVPGSTFCGEIDFS